MTSPHPSPATPTPPEAARSAQRSGSGRGTATRRAVLAAAGAGAGVLAVAACGSTQTPAAAPSTGTTSGPAAGGSSAAAGSSTAAAANGSNVLTALSAVPVGGAVGVSDSNGKPIIVAQPTAGQVVAFSAICTHQGCTVKPAGKELDCPCHASVFDAFTGKVLGGPAPSPLPAVSVAVQNGNVVPS